MSGAPDPRRPPLGAGVTARVALVTLIAVLAATVVLVVALAGR